MCKLSISRPQSSYRTYRAVQWNYRTIRSRTVTCSDRTVDVQCCTVDVRSCTVTDRVVRWTYGYVPLTCKVEQWTYIVVKCTYSDRTVDVHSCTVDVQSCTVYIQSRTELEVRHSAATPKQQQLQRTTTKRIIRIMLSY